MHFYAVPLWVMIVGLAVALVIWLKVMMAWKCLIDSGCERQTRFLQIDDDDLPLDKYDIVDMVHILPLREQGESAMRTRYDSRDANIRN